MVRVAAGAVVLVLATAAGAAQQPWRSHAPVPLARTEVAAARLGAEIAVVGGFLPGGANSARADAFSPGSDRWRRLQDLPVSVDHAAAASYRGRVYVLGGYSSAGVPQRTAWVLERRKWRALPLMPFPRAAAGAAFANGKIVVEAKDLAGNTTFRECE